MNDLNGTRSTADAPEGKPEITVFKKRGGILSKQITLRDDGSLFSDASGCKMSEGSASRRKLGSARLLAALINMLDADQALALGRLGPDLPVTVNIVTKAALGGAPAGSVARTADFLHFAHGQPAWMLLDVDIKGMPAEVMAKVEGLGGYWGALCEAFPDLAHATHVQRASTSAGIINPESGQRFDGSGGAHIYVLVADGADIPRALKVMLDRLWLKGYGWMLVSNSGLPLVRGLIDASVGRPERLVFEGGPVVQPPLEQDQSVRVAAFHEGVAIDTRVMLPDLAPAETAELEKLKATAKRALGEGPTVARSAFLSKHGKSIAQRENIPLVLAQEKAAASFQGILMPGFTLCMDEASLGELTVGAILEDPERYVGETLADPLEGPEYGWCKAKILRKADGSLFINSFAHGGMRYELRLDRRALEHRIRSLESEAVLAALPALLAQSHLLPGDEDQLVSILETTHRISKRSARRVFKDARDAAARHVFQSPNALNARVSLPAPDPNGELTPVLSTLDDILCQSSADSTPMRNALGRLVQVRLSPSLGLHRLVESEAEGNIPPPPEPIIQEMDAAKALLMIEEHVEYVRDRDDRRQSVRLPHPFVAAYLDYPSSRLPRIATVSTAPVISPLSGRPLLKSGLDQNSGVYHRVEPALAKCVPSPDDVDEEAIRNAYRFLTEEWLADVTTGPDGKATAIALALTIIQRIALHDGRPAFFITAAQRGGGKTTLAQMITAAVLGRPAAVTAWAKNDEERRKAVLALLLSGSPAIIWDNLDRGSAIASPTLERALTSSEYSDRMLGTNQTMTVPCMSVMVFTGNRIEPMGDMASRSLVIQIEVDRLDPEDRQFRHQNPIAWSTVNRSRILDALYTLLVGNPYFREPIDQRRQPKSRFKTWAATVGFAVEYAASTVGTTIDFGELFKANDAVDEEAEGATAFVAALYSITNGKPFTASEIISAFDALTFEKGFEFRHALDAAMGYKVEGVITSRRLAKIMKRVLNRPVELEGRLVRLTEKFRGKDHLTYEIVDIPKK